MLLIALTLASLLPTAAHGYRKRVPGQLREAEDFIDSLGLTPSAGFASSVEDLAS
jgi:hypothetical protein